MGTCMARAVTTTEDSATQAPHGITVGHVVLSSRKNGRRYGAAFFGPNSRSQASRCCTRRMSCQITNGRVRSA